MKSTCPNTVIALDRNLCDGDLLSACLHRVGQIGDCESIKLPIDSKGFTVGPHPETVTAGVWHLSVKTECGCYSTLVSLTCSEPKMKSEHYTHNIRDISLEC